MKCIEDEIPFELPEGWAWARLGTVCSKVTDGTHHSPNNYPIGEYKYVTAKNIKLNGIILEDITYVTAEVHKEIFSRCNPEFGDILYIKDGATSGIATINTLHEEFSMLSSVALLKPAYGIDNWYMCYAMQSPYFYTITRGNMKGVGITRITLNMLVSRLIPVPPLQEQKQISVKCRELISLSSNIENDKEFIRQILSETKSKILDLAIRGKLVPQDPNDEPASVLLERIRTEKEELIKQGKIKRNKKESVIFKGSDNSYYEKIGNDVTCIDDEILFDIPPTWNWCRLGTIGDWATGATPNRKNSEYFIGNIPWLKTGDLNDNYITYIPEHISEKALQQSSLRLNPTGSVLSAMYGATIGKLGILTFPATTNQACCACLPFGGIDNKYLFYYLMSQKSNFIYRGIGGAQSNISKEKIISTLFPLPPKEEQHMILSRIEKLMKLIRQFEELL